MTDIQLINNDTQVRFEKKLWHPTELVLAKCYGFHMDIDSGVITANIQETNKQAMFEFIRISFKNFSEAISEENRRNKFYERMEATYSYYENMALSLMAEKLPYFQKLYAHQKEGVGFGLMHRVNFLAFEMRLGKSITSASLTRILNIKRTVIICPAIAKWGWFRDLTNDPWGFNELYFTMLDSAKSKSFKALQERFIIINFDILAKFKDYILSDEVGHFIIDECFVYDTLIQTNLGMLKIGDIVKNKINCYALSFDSLNNEYIYKPVTNWLKKPLNKKLVKIKSNGREIICTEDHKIWTKDGYKKAICLSERDFVLGMREVFYGSEERGKYSSILFENLRFKSQQEGSGICKKKIGMSPEGKGENGVQFMQNRVFRTALSFIKKNVLFNFMFCKMGNERPFDEIEKKKDRHETIFGENKTILCKQSKSSEDIIGKNEIKQPDEKPRISCENEEKHAGKNIFISWWKWAINGTAKAFKFAHWMGNGTCDKYNRSEESVRMRSKSLQGRFSDSRQENCDRSGRNESQNKKMEIPRQEENGNFEYFRVESCEVLERGSYSESESMYREGYVYDLTVEDNHNYFANGILVSNCHRIKNRFSDRSKVIQEIVDRYPTAKITLLSGTPIPNRFNDLFNYFKIAGHPLGESYKKFTDEYTIKTASRGGEKVTGAKNIQDLKIKMANFMLVKKMDDCFDMPEDVVSRYTFDFDDYRDEYNAIIEEMAKEKNMAALRGHVHSINIITCKAKMKGMIQAIEDIIEEKGKVVVFGSYKEPFKILEEYFGARALKVDGTTNSYDRDRYKREFWDNPEKEVFLGQYLAAGEALDLSIASDVFHINFPFTSRELRQAQFRCKHPEKKGQHLRIHYTFAKDSIDENLYNLLISKERDINQLMDGKEVVEMEKIEEILIKNLLNKNELPIDNNISLPVEVPVVETIEEKTNEGGIENEGKTRVEERNDVKNNVQDAGQHTQSPSFEEMQRLVTGVEDNKSQFLHTPVMNPMFEDKSIFPDKIITGTGDDAVAKSWEHVEKNRVPRGDGIAYQIANKAIVPTVTNEGLKEAVNEMLNPLKLSESILPPPPSFL